MDATTCNLLNRFLRSCNNTATAERTAKGFVNGRRIDSLRRARQDEQHALDTLADWTAAQAGVLQAGVARTETTRTEMSPREMTPKEMTLATPQRVRTVWMEKSGVKTVRFSLRS